MMERPDWKSYRDGTMPQAERERLYEAMAGDEALRLDYQGYCEFVETLREKVLAEPIPNFDFGRIRPPLLRRPFAFAAAGTAVLVLAVIGMRQVPSEQVVVSGPAFSDAPVIDRIATKDPNKASDWLGGRVAHAAPMISIGQAAPLQGAMYAKDWAGYEFSCPEGTLRLRFSNRDRFEPCKTVVIAGDTYYVSEGLGWRQNGLSFHLSGQPGVPLNKLVVMFHKNIAGSRWIGTTTAKSSH